MPIWSNYSEYWARNVRTNHFNVFIILVKSLDAFATSIKNYEVKMEGQFDFISALVSNIRIDDIQLAIDTIMLVSTLAENDDVLNNSIQGNKLIASFIKAFLNHYKVQISPVEILMWIG